MSPFQLSRLVDAARRRVRQETALTIAALVAAVVPVALVIAWVLGGLKGWMAPGPGPLLLMVGALLLCVALALLGRRRWLRGIDEGAIAARAEEGVGLPSGSVRGVLELGRNIPRGTSAALFRKAEADVSRHFVGRTVRDVSGELGRVVRRRRAAALAGFAGLTALAVGLGFLSPQRSQAAWTPLLHPVAHLTPPPLPPLRVQPGNAVVQRGQNLEVRIEAQRRDAVILASRAAGDVLRKQTVNVNGDRAQATLERIDAVTEYWVEAPDGARSETYTVTPEDPLLVSELVVDVLFPAYVGRAAEHFESDVPPLEIPEGSQLVVRGRTTRSLRDATLQNAEGVSALTLTVDDDHFEGRWTPNASGIFEWSFHGTDGATPSAAPPPLELTIVRDAPPQVEVTYPTQDTIIDPELLQIVAADARDDYGIANVVVVSWRVTSAGKTEPPVEQPLQFDATGDRVLLSGVLDATQRGLLAGDTLKFLVRVYDNSPRRQQADSRIFSLRLPGADELRDQAGNQADQTIADANQLTNALRTLEQTTRDLQRRANAANARRTSPAQGGRGGGGQGNQQSLDFQETEQARGVLDQQQKMLEKMQELRDRLDAMQRSGERAGLQDPALQQQLKELREMYDQLLSPEMKQKLDELRNALQKMDPREVERALEKLSEQQEQMRKELEKSLEKLQKAAAEQEMNALAQSARELSAQQQALAESMSERPPNREQTEQQEKLSEKTRDLNAQLKELEKKLQEQGEAKTGEKTGEAGKEVSDAQRAMEEAAARANQRQGEQASAKGKEAASKLNEAAKKLDAARQVMADEEKREMQESIQRATNEVLSLAERQQALRDKMDQQGQTPPQPPQPPQAGQQAGQQQQTGQQAGQRTGAQQQSGQQSGQQQTGQQQSGQQAGQRQGGAQQQGQQGQQQGGQQGQQAGQQGAQAGQGGGQQDVQSMRAEQRALQQGLEQVGRNLTETGEKNAQMSRDVGAALGRANLNMQQTVQALDQAQSRMPTQEAAQSVEALNRLALALLNSSQQMEQSGQQASAAEQMRQELGNVAKQQGSLNGQANALMPMNLSQRALSQQVGKMSEQQREIANKLEGMSERPGGRDNVLGNLDQMAREAEELSRAMQGGRLTPEMLARQERLFHRLLDAGRTLEKDEYSEERKGQAAAGIAVSRARALDPSLTDAAARFPVPTPEELKGLSPALRRIILEYFERLNRPGSVTGSGSERR